jgi:hypothetical protein
LVEHTIVVSILEALRANSTWFRVNGLGKYVVINMYNYVSIDYISTWCHSRVI